MLQSRGKGVELESMQLESDLRGKVSAAVEELGCRVRPSPSALPGSCSTPRVIPPPSHLPSRSLRRYLYGILERRAFKEGCVEVGDCSGEYLLIVECWGPRCLARIEKIQGDCGYRHGGQHVWD